jgi:hypothetical protein
VVQEVLDNESTLGHDNGLWISRVLDADDRRLAQRVDLLQLWGGEVRLRVSVEDYQLIRELQFFNEP